MKFFTITLFLFVFSISLIFSQAPAGFNYQAVLRDAAGQVLTLTDITLEVNIRQGSTDGTVVFSETHQVQTSEFGLVSLHIGSVNPLDITQWGGQEYFIEVIADGVAMGSSKLLSVPFALHSQTSADAFSGDYNDLIHTPGFGNYISINEPQPGDIFYFSGQGWQKLPAGTDGQILRITGGLPRWITYLEGGNENNVIDIDGNVYRTVIIGQQEWIAENLRTTRYKNGETILTDLDDNQWGTTTHGASAVHPFEDIDGINTQQEMINAYGRLYNWAAAADFRGICPVGWHTPTSPEWNQLSHFIVNEHGFPEDVDSINGPGNHLKSCRQVDSPSQGCSTTDHPRWNNHHIHYGFDTYDFSAMPAGYKSSTGSFGSLGTHGLWWTTSPGQTSPDNKRAHFISFDRPYITIMPNYSMKAGLSVRCVRNIDTEISLPTIDTTPVSGISPISAISGGIVSDNGNVDYTISGLVWNTVGNPTVEYNQGLWAEFSGLGEFSKGITGLSPETTYYVRAFSSNSMGIVYGQEQQFQTLPIAPDVPGTVQDIDGNSYSTIIIGQLEWTTSDLRTTRFNNGEIIPFYEYMSSPNYSGYTIYKHSMVDGLNSDQEVLDAYGRLYNWHAVADARGLCPAGWHTSSVEEWDNLVTTIISSNEEVNTGNAANALKSCRQVNSPLEGDCNTTQHPRWASHPSIFGNDAFGFSAISGTIPGFYGKWWVSGDNTNFFKDAMEINYFSGSVSSITEHTTGSLQVRCVRAVE